MRSPGEAMSITEKHNWRNLAAGATLIVLMVLIAYLPALQGGFVWDDDVYVTLNPLLRSPEGLWKIWFDIGSFFQYYPLTLTGFWAQYHLWGLNPLGYHLVNVLLHSLTAIILWRIFRFLSIPGSWFAALVFALHPVQVESVAWVTELKNVLSGFLYVISFLSGLIYFQGGYTTESVTNASASANQRAIFYWVSLVLYIGAVLSKTIACTLPAALLLVIWWKRGSIRKREIKLLLPFFAVGTACGLLTIWMERSTVGAVGVGWEFSFLERLLIAGRALWFYAGKLLWPQEIIFNYPRWTIDVNNLWQYAYLLAALAVIALLWFGRHRFGRGPITAVLFFVGTLFPALGFFNVYPMRFSFVADHFQYLASVGLIVLFTAVTARYIRRLGPQAVRVAIILVSLMLVLLGWQSWNLGYAYENEETLYRDIISKNPKSTLAYSNLGLVLFSKAKFKESAECYKESLRIGPNQPNVLTSLGSALFKLGNYEEAFIYHREALRLDPQSVRANCVFGTELAKVGRYREALKFLDKAYHLDPHAIYVLNNLGWVLATAADPSIRNGALALRLAEKACILSKYSSPGLLDTLAAAHAETGSFATASQVAEKALKIAIITNQSVLVKELGSRIQLYRSSRPFREKPKIAVKAEIPGKAVD